MDTPRPSPLSRTKSQWRLDADDDPLVEDPVSDDVLSDDGFSDADSDPDAPQELRSGKLSKPFQLLVSLPLRVLLRMLHIPTPPELE